MRNSPASTKEREDSGEEMLQCLGTDPPVAPGKTTLEQESMEDPTPKQVDVP